MTKKNTKIKTYSKGKPCKGTITYPNPNVVNYTAQAVVDENGFVTYVNVPYDTSKLDLGDMEMYRIETLLAAGIQPASIHTSGNNRIATHEKIEGIIQNIDAVLADQPTENNTTTIEN